MIEGGDKQISYYSVEGGFREQAADVLRFLKADDFAVMAWARDRGIIVTAVKQNQIGFISPAFLLQEEGYLFAGISGHGGIDQFEFFIAKVFHFEEVAEEFAEGFISRIQSQADRGGVAQKENAADARFLLGRDFIAQKVFRIGPDEGIVDSGFEAPDKIRVGFVPIEK